MIQQIPNILTLTNLFSGCVAVICIFSDLPMVAVACVGVGLIADFLDGWAARKLGVAGPLGVQLDSLADMVSFGVAPAMMGYRILNPSPNFDPIGLPALLIAVFSGYRLAKFNIDTRQTSGFIGLATPANTIFWVGLWLIFQQNNPTFDFLWNPTVFYPLIFIFSYLLIAEIPMFSFKKGFGDKWILAFLILSVLLLGFFQILGISLVIVAYILLNIGQFFFQKN